MEYRVIDVLLPNAHFPTRAMVVCCLSDVTGAIAEEICKNFKSRDASFIILFHTGRIESTAESKFRREKHLMTSIADRLLTFQLSKKEARIFFEH